MFKRDKADETKSFALTRSFVQDYRRILNGRWIAGASLEVVNEALEVFVAASWRNPDKYHTLIGRCGRLLAWLFRKVF